jgi:hypothetical protein
MIITTKPKVKSPFFLATKPKIIAAGPNIIGKNNKLTIAQIRPIIE